MIKNALDSAQGIVYKNDNYIDAITATRRLAKSPKLTFTIREMLLDENQKKNP
jgi:Holliday junction resolvase RusA-like endonuclease